MRQVGVARAQQRMVRRASRAANTMRLPWRSHTPDVMQEKPQTPRARMCRVVIKEQFSEPVGGANYLNIFTAADRVVGLSVAGHRGME
jgi:hypothetical protein